MPEICLAGTGGMLPLPERFLTGLYVSQNGKALLIDCGEGMQVALAAQGLKLSRLNAIILTHCHADHVTGLPGLLLSLGNCSRSEAVEIIFPESMENTVMSLLNVCGGLPYDIRLLALPEDRQVSFTLESIDPMLTVSTLPLRHSVPCLGYRLSFAKHPRFDPEKADRLGVPKELRKLLAAGESVTLDDGRTVSPGNVTLGEREPTVITYTTDTLPIEEIIDFARSSDLFVCEGMYGSPEKKESMDAKGHMLMQDACRLAKQAGVGQLWLTHYSPAEKHPEVYRDELLTIFENTVISKDGQSAIVNNE